MELEVSKHDEKGWSFLTTVADIGEAKRIASSKLDSEPDNCYRLYDNGLLIMAGHSNKVRPIHWSYPKHQFMEQHRERAYLAMLEQPALKRCKCGEQPNPIFLDKDHQYTISCSAKKCNVTTKNEWSALAISAWNETL